VTGKLGKNNDMTKLSLRENALIETNPIFKNEVLILAVFYTVMHGGILLMPHAVFWDDWVLYRAAASTILDTFRQTGAMFNWAGWLHVGMLGLGEWTYKVLTFLLMFATGLLLRSILKRIDFLPSAMRFAVVLLFLVLPFNFARVAMIDFPYTLCYFLFFLGWQLIDRHRYVALLLFFLSFNTNSLLVFYAVPILDLAYRSGHLTSLRTAFSFIFRRLDFLLLPFLYFYIKLRFFLPSGLYAGYNQDYSLTRIPSRIAAQIDDLAGLDINYIILAIAMPLVLLLVRSHLGNSGGAGQQHGKSRLLTIWALGFLVLALGCFPYWIVGHIPSFREWNSRHQLLMPLGAALIIAASVFLLRAPIKIFAFAAVIAASLSYGIVGYYSFLVDWNKQQTIMKFFVENATVRNANLVVIDDNTEHLNAIGREYRFYEWNGLIEKAYGDERRFAIVPRDIEKYRRGEFDQSFSSHYKAGFHHRDAGGPIAFVKINTESGNARVWSRLAFPQVSLSATSQQDVSK
jgi:hypothetical protein